ncbi:hypothetical protein D3C86_2121070 [compost metagenome]
MLQRVMQADIGQGKRCGVAQTAHQHIIGRPGADAANAQQLFFHGEEIAHRKQPSLG